jgi:hypothetical protein
LQGPTTVSYQNGPFGLTSGLRNLFAIRTFA